MPGFLVLLLLMALNRANPKLGEVGHNDECAYPLPECLDALLKSNILTNAKRDKLALVKSSLETDAEIQAMLRELPQLAATTVISVAHRLHTIIDYDAIAVLDDGACVELGSPHALLQDPAGFLSCLVDATSPETAAALRRTAQSASDTNLKDLA